MSLSETNIKWAIFGALVLLFPAAFHLILAVLVSPLFLVLVNEIASLSRGHFDIIFIIYCLIWMCLYYWVSKITSAQIFRREEKYRALLFSAVILIIILFSFAPINTDISENSLTVYEKYQERIGLYIRKYKFCKEIHNKGMQTDKHDASRLVCR